MIQEEEVDWTFDELVDPKHSAVIVVDMQNDFCSDKGALEKAGLDCAMEREMAPRLGKFLTAARKTGVNIIHVRNVQSDWTLSPVWRRKMRREEITLLGTWGAEAYEGQPELTSLKGEYVVQKHRYSGFVGTDLQLILKSLGVRTLILAGTHTNACVESTARDGFMLEFHIVFLTDCTSALSPQAHEASLRNIDRLFGDLADSNQVVKAWSAK
ncbi:MAG: cysteine hydrolase family protein [Nitrososphaerales archaeon]